MLYSDKISSIAIKKKINLYQVMAIMCVALLPTLLHGLYQFGFRTNQVIYSKGLTGFGTWHDVLLGILTAYDPNQWSDNFFCGLIFFLPIFCVAYGVGLLWELVFAWYNKKPLQPGLLVTTLLFSLICPFTTSLGQVALGISFSVVFVKELLGGLGKNMINPALGGIAFLFLTDPAFFSMQDSGTAIDAYSAPTALMLAKKSGLSVLIEEISWADALTGQIMGVIGETSKIAIVLGAVILIVTGIGSWRIMLGGFLGLIFTSLIFNGIGSVLNPMYYLPWYWHLISGGFLFALTFMATDPVTAPMTSIGRWIYGVLIGGLTVVIRVLSPAYIEGVMMAILAANICAPSLDRLIIAFRQRVTHWHGG